MQLDTPLCQSVGLCVIIKLRNIVKSDSQSYLRQCQQWGKVTSSPTTHPLPGCSFFFGEFGGYVDGSSDESQVEHGLDDDAKVKRREMRMQIHD